MGTDNPILKGEFGGECYRTSCNAKNASLYNHSTRKFYCNDCAELINAENFSHSMRMYGHVLCTPPPITHKAVLALKKQKDFLLWLDFSSLGKIGEDYANEMLANIDNILAEYGVQ